MNSQVKISCSISSSDTNVPLGLEIWLDQEKIFDQEKILETVEFSYLMSDDEAEHELSFLMKNKTLDHTQIDQQGNIVRDAVLTLKNLAFDDIQLGHTFIDLATYTHNFNGTNNPIQEKFYENMGCNGTVSLKFTTPMYLWLLEHM